MSRKQPNVIRSGLRVSASWRLVFCPWNVSNAQWNNSQHPSIDNLKYSTQRGLILAVGVWISLHVCWWICSGQNKRGLFVGGKKKFIIELQIQICPIRHKQYSRQENAPTSNCIQWWSVCCLEPGVCVWVVYTCSGSVCVCGNENAPVIFVGTQMLNCKEQKSGEETSEQMHFSNRLQVLASSFTAFAPFFFLFFFS